MANPAVTKSAACVAKRCHPRGGAQCVSERFSNPQLISRFSFLPGGGPMGFDRIACAFTCSQRSRQLLN